MTAWVVDASVAVKWYLPEPHSDAAAALLESRHALLAPDFLWPEFANALTKRCTAGELDLDDAGQILEALRRSPVEFHATPPLLPGGMRIAVDLGRAIDDSLYLALAVREGAKLVTADRKYFKALERSRWAKHTVWVEDAT